MSQFPPTSLSIHLRGEFASLIADPLVSQVLPHEYIDYVIAGDITKVKRALEKGWDLCDNGTAQDGEHALHYAAMHNHAEILKLLIDASCRRVLEIGAPNGRTPLAAAVEHQAVDTMKVLLRAGANVWTIPETDRDWLLSQPWYAEFYRCQQQHTGYNPTCEQDQRAAFRTIQDAARLPSNLIIKILDLAEYWICSKVRTNEHRTIATRNRRPQELPRYDNDLDRCYLRSQPITGKQDYPVKKIVFEIISRDQGFDDHARNLGSYEASGSCFSVHCESQDSLGDDLIICKNAHGLRTLRKHIVAWPHEEGYHWYHGRSEEAMERWLQKLQNGDRVVIEQCVNSEALYIRGLNWENRVHGAIMWIYTSYL